MDLVRFGIDSAELVKKIKDLGIDFEPTQDYMDALRRAGAQEPVIEALREKPKPLTKEQVGKLVVGGVPNERASALVKQRGIDFEADEQYLETLRVAGADDNVLGSLRAASAAAATALEEGKLEEVRNASAQLLVWRNAGETTLLEKAVAGDQAASAFCEKLRASEQRFKNWQRSEWVPDLAEQKHGNLVGSVEDGTATACCLPGTNTLYVVEAPPQARWLIMMEKLRWEIGDTNEIDQFRHAKTTGDSFLAVYQGVWQEARDFYCKHGPGAKYTDLNDQEQVCSQPEKTSRR
jgi:hypothetical protein